MPFDFHWCQWVSTSLSSQIEAIFYFLFSERSRDSDCSISAEEHLLLEDRGQTATGNISILATCMLMYHAETRAIHSNWRRLGIQCNPCMNLVNQLYHKIYQSETRTLPMGAGSWVVGLNGTSNIAVSEPSNYHVRVEHKQHSFVSLSKLGNASQWKSNNNNNSAQKRTFCQRFENVYTWRILVQIGLS